MFLIEAFEVAQNIYETSCVLHSKQCTACSTGALMHHGNTSIILKALLAQLVPKVLDIHTELMTNISQKYLCIDRIAHNHKFTN